MRRFGNGHVTEQDIDRLNSRYIENDDVNLPPVNELRFACSNNQERNAISNYVFLKHLDKTHEKSNDTSISLLMSFIQRSNRKFRARGNQNNNNKGKRSIPH